MTRSNTLQVTDADITAILNALNYFGHGCSASECSTLLGMDQEGVRRLYKKINETQMRAKGPAEKS
ncbi:hypothetical protein [Affinirhizobium pseudoryzae]|jgi:hypothetical protein|uniref:hypothetical protein n=1 Tax=Allorhizobium pseudoryzae TaxID=379684 RepID=UPI0013EBB38C|nr:hypothetical protein [Allorhizobium pseudoryzae]